MYFFLKYIITLFSNKLRIKIVASLLRESGPSLLSTLMFMSQILMSESQIPGPLEQDEQKMGQANNNCSLTAAVSGTS